MDTDVPRRSDFLLESELVLPRQREEVFAFFADPANLEELTPPWLGFEILGASTESIEAGTLIDYKLRVRGLPLSWRSLISAWEPPARFVDEQLRGPYRSWIHEHLFEDLGGETRVVDRVRYAVPGGRWVERLLVRPDLERIFRFRRERLSSRFAP